jgi:hypothetical protein
MEDTPTRTLQGSSPAIKSIEITSELEKAINALPPPSKYGYGIIWTPEMEDLLLKYWRVRDQQGIAKILGVGHSTAKKKYRELIMARQGRMRK